MTNDPDKKVPRDHLKIYLVGPTGCGKTLMARYLTKFLMEKGFEIRLHPDYETERRGHIPLNGQNIDNVITVEMTYEALEKLWSAKPMTLEMMKKLYPAGDLR